MMRALITNAGLVSAVILLSVVATGERKPCWQTSATSHVYADVDQGFGTVVMRPQVSQKGGGNSVVLEHLLLFWIPANVIALLAHKLFPTQLHSVLKTTMEPVSANQQQVWLSEPACMWAIFFSSFAAAGIVALLVLRRRSNSSVLRRVNLTMGRSRSQRLSTKRIHKGKLRHSKITPKHSSSTASTTSTEGSSSSDQASCRQDITRHSMERSRWSSHSQGAWVNMDSGRFQSPTPTISNLSVISDESPTSCEHYELSLGPMSRLQSESADRSEIKPLQDFDFDELQNFGEVLELWTSREQASVPNFEFSRRATQ